MSLSSTQGLQFKLVAEGEILDLFSDEQIFLSDNVTGLFDIGILPADFTRQITIPGTKKNNAFFEHVYDISIFSPDTFATNQKVSCYIDFGGIYLAQGYLQLNKVNVLANKYIESYEISIYGAVSSFAREISRNFLTDMTASLAQYNHTASLSNITASWEGNLFNGDIVYPFAEYGQKILYAPEENIYGIESEEGSLFVQDYKPSIRVKKVWDAIFNQYGYTYSGSFFEEPFLDNVYMVCNNQLRYPIFDNINLETYGQFKIAPVSGSTDSIMIPGNDTFLPWYNILSNPNNNINESLSYDIEYPTTLRGILRLNIKVENLGNGQGIPQFQLVIKSGGPFSGGFNANGFQQGTALTIIDLPIVNQYFRDIRTAMQSQNLNTATQKYTIDTEFLSTYLAAGDYQFYLQYTQFGGTNFRVVLDPDGELKSYLEVTKVGNVGEGMVMKIGQNMPFGVRGIKQIDFITSIQKKFNLMMYPSKTKRNEFIVESFNNWYNKGEIWNFNNYVNLDETIEVIPANNLAVNELNFGDTLDQDYISQQFSKLANREYGKNYYVDTQNFFSQGTFEVKTALASAPIIYLNGTGVSGSQQTDLNYFINVSDESYDIVPSTCNLFGSFSPDSRINRTYVDLVNTAGDSVINYGDPIVVSIQYTINNQFTSFTTIISITIPFGATSAFYEYATSAYTDQGRGFCEEETQAINCIINTGGTTVYPSSQINIC